MERFVYQAMLHPEDDVYRVEIPDLPGCLSFGRTYREAIEMGIDAMKTYIAALMACGDPIPEARFGLERPEGLPVVLCVETDESYIVEGDVVSAAQAARDLDISPSRVTHMIRDGILVGYRQGRRTYVTKESIRRRKESPGHAGRPRQ